MTRPRPGRLAALLAALVALVALAVAAVPAGAGPGTTVPGTVPGPPGTAPGSGKATGDGSSGRDGASGSTTDGDTTTPSDPARPLRLLGQTPFVAPTDTLVLTLAVDALPADATLTFELYGSVTARAGRNGIDETLAGENVTGVLSNNVRDIPIAFLAPNPAGGVDVPLQIISSGTEPEFGFRLSEAGVYPLRIRAFAPGGRDPLGELTTYVIRVPATSREERPPLSVASLVPYAAPPALRTDGTVHLDPTRATALRRLTATLGAEADVPLTVAPVPETVDALAGTEPTVVTSLGLALTGRQVVAGPYVTLDTTAWLDADLDDEFRAQLTTGAATLTTRLGATPLPDRRTWIAQPTTTPSAFGALATFGIDRTVLPESMLVPLDPKESATTLAQPFEIQDDQGGRLRAVMADLRLAARLTVSPDPALAAQVLLADLAAIWFETPTVARGTVVAVPVDDPHAVAALTPFLEALTWQPAAGADAIALVRPTTVESLFDLPPATRPGAGQSTQPLVRPYVPQAPIAGHESLGTYPQRLDAAQLSVDGYRSMVEATAPERVPPLQRLLDVSGAAAFDDAERQAYLDSSTAQIQAQVGALSLPPDPEGVTLAATEAEIPLVVESALDHPVTVRIAFASEKLEFTAGDTTDAVLQPGTNKLSIPVRTRASGLFPVDVTMRSPDGSITIASTRFQVRSTAISGLGLVLSIGAGIFLAIWWARHWRDGRRARKLVDGTPDDQPAPAATGVPAGAGEAGVPSATGPPR